MNLLKPQVILKVYVIRKSGPSIKTSKNNLENLKFHQTKEKKKYIFSAKKMVGIINIIMEGKLKQASQNRYLSGIDGIRFERKKR